MQLALSTLDWMLAASVLYVLLPASADARLRRLPRDVPAGAGRRAREPSPGRARRVRERHHARARAAPRRLRHARLAARLPRPLLPPAAAARRRRCSAATSCCAGAPPSAASAASSAAWSRRSCRRRSRSRPSSAASSCWPRARRRRSTAPRLAADVPAAAAARALALLRQPGRRRAAAARARAAAPSRRRVPRHRRAPRRGHRVLAAEGPRLRGGDSAHGDAAGAAALPRATSTAAPRCSTSRSRPAGASPSRSSCSARSGCCSSRTATSSTRTSSGGSSSSPATRRARSGRRRRRSWLLGRRRARAPAAAGDADARREPSADDLARAAALVATSPRTYAHLALLGDKALLFQRRRRRGAPRAFLMYGVEGRSWVALGDPVGAPADARELAWRFRELCDRHGGWTVFYEVGAENLPLYLDLGLSLLKLGEEARVPLDDVLARRRTRGRAPPDASAGRERRGELRDRPGRTRSAPLLPSWRRLRRVARGEEHAREGLLARLLLARLPPARPGRGRAGAATRSSRSPTCSLGAEHEELSIDLMRYVPATRPPGVMDYLFLELMLWGRAEGYRWFSLGMAPFSGFDVRTLAPLWNRAGAFLFRQGEHFYNFQGVRAVQGRSSTRSGSRATSPRPAGSRCRACSPTSPRSSRAGSRGVVRK